MLIAGPGIKSLIFMKNDNTYHIEDDINLEAEFAKIGFDYKTMLNSARFVNPWIFFLATEDTRNAGEKVCYSFVVVRYGNSYRRCIHQICAALVKSMPNSNQTKIIISKEYWDYNGPFPTRTKMHNDLINFQKSNSTWTDGCTSKLIIELN